MSKKTLLTEQKYVVGVNQFINEMEDEPMEYDINAMTGEEPVEGASSDIEVISQQRGELSQQLDDNRKVLIAMLKAEKESNQPDPQKQTQIDLVKELQSSLNELTAQEDAAIEQLAGDSYVDTGLDNELSAEANAATNANNGISNV